MNHLEDCKLSERWHLYATKYSRKKCWKLKKNYVTPVFFLFSVPRVGKGSSGWIIHWAQIMLKGYDWFNEQHIILLLIPLETTNQSLSLTLPLSQVNLNNRCFQCPLVKTKQFTNSAYYLYNRSLLGWDIPWIWRMSSACTCNLYRQDRGEWCSEKGRYTFHCTWWI